MARLLALALSLLLLPAAAAAQDLDRESYPWLDDWDEAPERLSTLDARFPPPEGFERIDQQPSSFGSWLRAVPLRGDRDRVHSYRGASLQRPAAAVLAIDVGSRDLMQCADSAIRLHAEWLWASGRSDEAAYHFTSGDRTSWPDWVRGERFVVQGSRVERVQGKTRSSSHASFRRWLDQVFMYAGTRSLHRDSTPVPEGAPLQPGDFFVQGGSPGHAVVLLDIAEHPDGRRVALVGQGFMPAEDIHVLRWDASRGTLDGVWFLLDDGELSTPSWAPFARDEARRFVP